MKFKLIKHKKEIKIPPNNKLIDKYCLADLKNNVNLFLYNELNNEELENLKYLSDDTELNLYSDSVFSFKKVIEKLKELGKNNKIILRIFDKNNFNKYLFKEDAPDYENAIVKYNSDEYTLNKYIYFEALLYKIIEPALGLTPFEKYIYAYNIVKQFKEYKENDNPKLERHLYDILFNKYAVCVGFCTFFSDLLTKFNISNIGFSIEGKDEQTDSKWGHKRLYVNIKDEKYGINGFYVSDPTWDNDLEKDYYNHLALTNTEAKLELKFNYVFTSAAQKIFDISNINELYFVLLNISKEHELGKVLKIIKALDLNYYKYLSEKYDIKTIDEKMIKDISSYIYNHINNPISGDTIMSAVEVVYKHSYGYQEEDLYKKLEEVRQLNFNRHNCLFPRKIIDKDNNKEELILLENKFHKNNYKKL